MESISKEIHRLNTEKSKLIEGFYKVYDPSRLWAEWREATKGNRELSGEGRHFRSYRIPSPGGGLDLAINSAKASFYQERPKFIRNWVLACKALAQISHPLLPPFEVLEGEDGHVLIVMPYCESALSPEQGRDLGIRKQLSELEVLLEREDWTLDDYWQLRCCQGHVFVTDFSELKRKSAREASVGPRLR